MARMPGTTPRSGGPRGIEERAEGGLGSRATSVTGGSRSPMAKATAMASTVAAAIRNAGRMPSIRPSIRKTMAPTHIWNVTDPVASER